MVEEGVEHEELGIIGFDFSLFDEKREGCVGGDVKGLHYFFNCYEVMGWVLGVEAQQYEQEVR